jgi:hypothetical protein
MNELAEGPVKGNAIAGAWTHGDAVQTQWKQCPTGESNTY